MRTTIALTAALLLFAACSREATTAATPVAATTLPADVRDLAKTAAPKSADAKAAVMQPASESTPSLIAATGELISPMRSQVAPKQAGRVAAVFVREGARVHAGQPLAAFETEYLRLDLRRAEAELARAQAMENDAARDLQRKRDLVNSESISRANFDILCTRRPSTDSARSRHAAGLANPK